jgi:hypothetical protein
MTRLTDLMSEGYRIQISEAVTPGTVFPYIDPASHETTLAFHPFDYSYISNDDIFKAHEINMLRIYADIEKSAEEAIARLDKMVYEMDHKHDPKVYAFMPNTEVIENEDGSYTFVAVSPNEMHFYEPETSSMSEDEIMRRYG